ncbi:MAG: MBL fold metallo-hydrolase RNA specificity domain-containing protein, partial [Nanoarchaeota archaeon]
LDHVGAVPYMAEHYKAPIYGTPFTLEILNSLARDNNLKIRNPRKPIMPNSSVMIGKTKVEFIHITHSTLQTSIVVLHTKHGAVVYANDFKFDNYPVVGKKPNYARIQKIANEGVLALIVDSLYADEENKTLSEKIARDMLEDVLLATNNKGSCIVITTFSSHLARLKSIVDFGKQLDRKIVFCGRSLHKYVSAAIKSKLINFHKDIQMFSYKNQVKKKLKEVEANRDKYIIVCTGHQGEPGSILVKLAHDAFPFHLTAKDHVIFSSKTIPSPINIANRKALEKKLKEKSVRIFTDLHVSGHAMREDLRDLILMLKPKNLIPTHGDIQKLTSLAELSIEEGYKLGKNVHIMQNGQSLNLI